MPENEPRWTPPVFPKIGSEHTLSPREGEIIVVRVFSVNALGDMMARGPHARVYRGEHRVINGEKAVRWYAL